MGRFQCLAVFQRGRHGGYCWSFIAGVRGFAQGIVVVAASIDTLLFVEYRLMGSSGDYFLCAIDGVVGVIWIERNHWSGVDIESHKYLSHSSPSCH